MPKILLELTFLSLFLSLCFIFLHNFVTMKNWKQDGEIKYNLQ